jgi:CubicO group peptidase (beta-lactamase class C family)
MNFKAGIKEGKIPASPFASQTRAYYGRHLEKEFNKMKIDRNPGEKYEYSMTAESHVLGEVIKRTTGVELDVLYDSLIWSKIGTTHDALWSMDRNGGQVKPFCCFHAHARDYAKLGRLMLNDGKWNGEQVLPQFWVNDLYTCVNECDHRYEIASSKTNKDYNYSHWFLGTKGYNELKASGLFGQYVYIFPDQNTLILTFTNRDGMNRGIYQVDIHYEIIDQLNKFR